MTRTMNPDELNAYNEDGVAVLRNAISADWVARMNDVIDQQLAQPSKWGNDANPGAKTNRHFSDRYQWQDNAEINAYIHESGCAGLAAQAMGSETARFYFDHLLVKEPGTANPTPWHQDVPYWPFLGSQICSIWLALTPSTVASSAMEFVRGSHLDGKYYMPEAFTGDTDANAAWMAGGDGEKCPDIANSRDEFDIIGFDMAPGDAVIFSAWTLHGAGGNASADTRRAAISTRWLGDNAIWHPHTGADPTVTQEHVSVQPGQPPHDDKVFPKIWPLT
ncbi:MAG: phytanoyl-CoA dioxygenase family protein [Alphaproteobacteria bacterium]|jgi:ectoine hydroxylase-related dioxygenase (phytanoyl-CoA dioxygenase family)|nr:phytanoyl-CoA dioxygenase family protein [Alphaproteobacteria bacterium]MBT4086218.1 phytanoyl-CoA dioxygenase family protein [Alphaproteobacteria bacterium]MBT4543835.1 phytanoyl-CoA dioxygenase family protein [Alphaproteobacteria bacterium]MBT7744815.1 phytanoyl-CoA dioxygenase family protein [Alphaproteobacteria bacterium]